MIAEAERDDIIYDQGWNFQDELIDLEPRTAYWKQFMHVTIFFA
jgi:hypothetical protein